MASGARRIEKDNDKMGKKSRRPLKRKSKESDEGSDKDNEGEDDNGDDEDEDKQGGKRKKRVSTPTKKLKACSLFTSALFDYCQKKKKTNSYL